MSQPARAATGHKPVGVPQDPRRMLMLVPHEPTDDPRIAWVVSLCREIGRTDVLGTTWSTEKQAREYDGRVYLERVNIQENSSALTKRVAGMATRLYGMSPLQRYIAREGQLTAASRANSRRLSRMTDWMRGVNIRVDHQTGAALRFAWAWGSYPIIIDALYRRARSTSVPPRLIICHDLYALIAAVALKRQFGCPVLYDSHEFWPQAELIGQPWEFQLLTHLERMLIGKADVVITVSPPLAHHLAKLYHLKCVLSVPNAEPFREDVLPSAARPIGQPVRFLLQGKIGPRRGIDTFLKAWCEVVADRRAVLYLRCPPTPYLEVLRARFSDAIERGYVVIAPAVREEELIATAAQADVGIIPYVGPNLNHVYSCPNKLSQFMHAGIAILTNRLQYVEEVVRGYRCGLTYQADDPQTLRAAVTTLVEHPEILQAFKENAYHAARREFNWQVQAEPYRAAVSDLFNREPGA